MFFGKITLTLSPDRSVPSESGITSLNVTSDNNSDPERTPANTVAPYAIASSGCSYLLSVLPSKYATSLSYTLGIRVEPPTRIISSI